MSLLALSRRESWWKDAEILILRHQLAVAPHRTLKRAAPRRRRARYTISREQLWDLHHGQRLSFTEIGQRTGYSRTAISDLARAYEIPHQHLPGGQATQGTCRSRPLDG
ncbi:MAG: hypothetical protein ACRDOU_30475 [Streptosporangiaceae bacterium]